MLRGATGVLQISKQIPLLFSERRGCVNAQMSDEANSSTTKLARLPYYPGIDIYLLNYNIVIMKGSQQADIIKIVSYQSDLRKTFVSDFITPQINLCS